ncbi:MAG: hypothetical protein ABWZ52_12915 [Acidimicrobiales bacterium]
MTTTAPRHQLPRLHRGGAAIGAVASLVTMPLTAMWFLLVGGGVLVAGLVRALVGGTPWLGLGGSVGFGLLVGPAVYIGLAVVQPVG